jgi:hypothetical protein
MSKEQTFRSEDTPFGIANGKSQIPNMESAICDLKFRVLARTRCSRFAPRSFLTAESGFKTFNRASRFVETVQAPSIPRGAGEEVLNLRLITAQLNRDCSRHDADSSENRAQR